MEGPWIQVTGYLMGIPCSILGHKPGQVGYPGWACPPGPRAQPLPPPAQALSLTLTPSGGTNAMRVACKSSHQAKYSRLESCPCR